MKKLYLLLLSLSILTACSSGSYRIKGQIDGVEDGTMVSLGIIDMNSLSTLDSMALKNGKFSFKGNADEPLLAFVTFDIDGIMNGCQFFLEEGTITVKFDAETGTQTIGGTVNNDAFQDFYDATDILNDEAEEIEDKIKMTIATDGDPTPLYNQMGDLQDRFKEIVASSIEMHPDILFGYQQLLENYSLFDADEIMPLLEKVMPYNENDITLMQLSSMVENQLKVSLGRKYIDFEADLLDKKGGHSTKASLSSYVAKNKIVMLDFWASWCTPCMNEVPNLKAAYKRFKSKGFEIVSVSVDEDIDEWKKAIKDKGMDWVQLWNGLEDMENSPAVQYTVSAIPCTFLIDSDGIIIGRDLRGSELEEALEDYFKDK